MFDQSIQLFFAENQNLLYFVALILDLGFTVLMYRFFGKNGLLACIVLSILLANLQGPKLTVIFGMQTSLMLVQDHNHQLPHFPMITDYWRLKLLIDIIL